MSFITSDQEGSLNLYQGKIRLLKPDGSWVEFEPREYADYIREHVEDCSYAKMPYAKCWNEGFSVGLQDLKGIYRANTLARINVAEKMATSKA